MTPHPDETRAAALLAADAVDAGGGRIEESFLQVGEVLGRALDLVGELTTRVEALPTELNGQDVTAASETLWRIAAEMSAVRDALPAERSALEGMAESLNGPRAPLERLVKNIWTIAILARTSRVESANLSDNRYNFVEFAQEISILADKARQMVGSYSREFSTLSTLVGIARESQRTFLEQRGEHIAQSVSSLQDAFDAIETRQQEAVAASRAVAQRSSRISEVVGDAVMTLQAGDSTRQRLEHVSEALRDAAGSGDMDDLSAQSGLQGAQLRHALVNFDQAIVHTGGSLAALADDAGAIVEIGRSLVGTGATAQPIHERLQASLSTAGELIHDCEAARASVDEVMGVLTATLATFRERLASLTSISQSITMVGLNAAIKSARLGPEGKALSVVSQDLRFYAEHIVADTGVLMSVFDDVIAAAAILESAHPAHGAAKMAQADYELATMLAALARNEAVVASALDLFSVGGARLSGMLAEAEAVFADLGDHMDTVRAAADDLTTLGRLADPARARLRLAPASYTMESEREVHDEVSRAYRMAG